MTDIPKKSAGKCPLCGKARQHEFRPFCSKRCADIDLGRWFNGQYRVPAEDAPDERDLNNVVNFPAGGQARSGEEN